MPRYDYHCETCNKDVTVSMSISEHDARAPSCPECGQQRMQPLVGSFFAKTSRKS
jgi:putative FmdB family regulatory protein